jgi:hypothetical protein
LQSFLEFLSKAGRIQEPLETANMIKNLEHLQGFRRVLSNEVRYSMRSKSQTFADLLPNSWFFATSNYSTLAPIAQDVAIQNSKPRLAINYNIKWL